MKRNREDSSEAARMKREVGGMGPRIWGVCCGTKRGHTLLLQARAQGLEEEPPRLSQVGRGGSAAQLGSLRAHSAPEDAANSAFQTALGVRGRACHLYRVIYF